MTTTDLVTLLNECINHLGEVKHAQRLGLSGSRERMAKVVKLVQVIHNLVKP